MNTTDNAIHEAEMRKLLPRYADEFLAAYDSSQPRPCDGCEYLKHSLDHPLLLTEDGDIEVGSLVCCYAADWGDPPGEQVLLSDDEIDEGGTPSWCPLPEPEPVVKVVITVTIPPKEKPAQLNLFDLGGA